MKHLRSLVATAAVGVIGIGGYAALPASAASRPSIQVAPAVATAPVPPVPAGCENEQWTDRATGQPANLTAGGTEGFYLWHTETGWHLEVTHPTHDHVVFSGWISTNGTLASQRVDDEKNDVVRVGPQDHVLSFAFNNYGFIDGVHFETHCADRLEVHLFIDGHPAPVEHIFLGHTSANPAANPFTLRRTAG